ncbi:MAG: hypothetical protein WAM39_24075 [Bryobacteraceae bacterium]
MATALVVADNPVFPSITGDDGYHGRFPEFMKHPAKRIAKSDQATPGTESYVFDGAEGSQNRFLDLRGDGKVQGQAHEYDEYMVAVQGCYTLIIDGNRILLRAGEKYFIPKGTLHNGEVLAGTRTIHAFGGHRADRLP